jgi:hypothetical protein
LARFCCSRVQYGNDECKDKPVDNKGMHFQIIVVRSSFG